MWLIKTLKFRGMSEIHEKLFYSSIQVTVSLMGLWFREGKRPMEI